MINKKISRFSNSKTRNRNRILLGLTTLGLSLGVMGTLSSRSAIQTFSRTSLTKTINKSLLTSNSQGLKATVPPLVSTVVGIAGIFVSGISIGLTGYQISQQNSLSGGQIEEEIQETKREIADLNVRVKNLEESVMNTNRRLKGILKKLRDRKNKE